MRIKRTLTMLLAVMMVLSMLAPTAVMAAGGDAVTGLDLAKAVKGESEWSVTKVDKDLNLTLKETPECIEELQKAAELFERDEKVMAFVVMEDEPLAESVSSINEVSSTDEQKLLSAQNEVIADIKAQLLDGGNLNVRYQFTYLTNSFTIETEFGNLAEIAMMDGVKSVFVMPVFYPATAEGGMSPMTETSGQMVGAQQVWQDLGYTGKGMKIAVLDTGLDLDHPSFAADPAEPAMTQKNIERVLKRLNAYSVNDTITADALYRSAKVPFAFNYADSNLTADHSADEQGDHGTHVSGIAAANKTEGTSVAGMAPDAQIIVMKVFGATRAGYMDDICAALEDALKLDCDVINASLGSPAGFSSSDSELDKIFERICWYDTVVNFSAGNEGTSSYGNLWGTDMNRTQNPDNAAVGSPSTYVNVMSIASADNVVVMTPYLTTGDGAVMYYTDPYTYTIDMTSIAGKELEYVMVDGLGAEEDFYAEDGTSLVEGKVAVILRGELNFSAKIFNAQNAGAVAAIIRNNEANPDEDIFNFGMQIVGDDGETYPSIPACLVSYNNGLAMEAAEQKTLTVSAEPGKRENSTGGQMSSFSSWGVSPDLGMSPDITGIGGSVYSCYDGGGYGLMSGTSMSAPQLSGVSALVLEYLQDNYPTHRIGTLRKMAENLLMSTADPIISADSGVEVSPRQQGAGLVNAYEALTTGAYLTVNDGRPKAELGDSADGTYTFSFQVHNVSGEDKTYTLDASLLTEDYAGARLSETEVEYFMYGVDMALSGDVTFDKDTVTVAAGKSAKVNVTVTLSEDDKALFDAVWENGGYVEGYVYLNAVDEEGAITEQLNLPFLGFYGDWTQAPVLDTAYWYDNSFWGVDPVGGVPEGDQYYHVVWTDLGGTDFVLGFNPYVGGPFADENGNVYYDPEYNVVSPNGDGYLDGIMDMYVSLLRNAKTMTVTYSLDGEVLSQEEFINNAKTMYRSNYGQIVPWIYSWYTETGYGFTDAQGNVLPSGTTVEVTIDADVDYGNGGDHTMSFPITVDTAAPELLSVGSMEQDGSIYLIAEAYDDVALGTIMLLDPTGAEAYGAAYDPHFVVSEEGTTLAAFDITGLGTDFIVGVGDYGANQVAYMVGLEIEGGNPPISDVTRIYGGDRIATSFAVAEASKAVLGVEQFEAVAVADAWNFPDALSGSYLSVVKNAPILLTGAGKEATTAAYIQENLAAGGTVYILGGEASVSADMEAALEGYTVKRLSGASRYDTNLAILNESYASGADLLVCTGTGFADSLSAAAVGLPVLMVGQSLTEAQEAFLTDTFDGANIYVIGGENSVVPAVAEALAAYGAVTRISGNSRYETSVKVAETFFDAPEMAVLANGQKFPDGLCGGLLAVSMNAPLILTEDSSASVAAAYTNGLSITAGVVLGGQNSIADATVRTIFGLTEDMVINEIVFN